MFYTNTLGLEVGDFVIKNYEIYLITNIGHEYGIFRAINISDKTDTRFHTFFGNDTVITGKSKTFVGIKKILSEK